MSDVLLIYDKLAAKTISVGMVAVGAKDLHQIPNSVDTAALPIRLLLPVGGPFTGPGTEGSFSFLGISTTSAVTWRIVDLLLWDTVGQGESIGSHGESLIEYQGAYAEVLRTIRGVASGGSNQAVIEGCDMTAGVFEWPVGGGKWFFGVLCVVRIREVLSGH